MTQMFSSSFYLHYVNFKNFNAENVLYMNHMFDGCWKLKSVDMTNFKTKNLIDITRMLSDVNP